MACARLLFVALSLAAPGSAAAPRQKGVRPPQAEPRRVVTPAGEVRVLSEAEATKLVARVKRLVLSRSARRDKKKRKKGTRLSFVGRLEETEALGRVRHPALVGVLKKILLTDPNDAVRVKAAEALLAQPKQQAVRVATGLLKDKKFLRRGSLAAPLIRLISFHGAPKAVWAALRRRFLDIGGLGQQALLRHVGASRDWNSVDLVLDNLDPPAPANVDDPNNPPAEYWRARWEQWRAFRPALREACEKLFGRSFATRKDAELWIAEQGGLAALRKKAGGR